MQSPRQRARRRLSHPLRLVTPQIWPDTMPLRWDEESVCGLSTGLEGARCLRRYFPEFYQQHVAQRTVTTARLLGVCHAFLELVHARLIRLDLDCSCPITLDESSDPSDVIDDYRDEGGILPLTLGQELYWWFVYPPLQLYGLQTDSIASALGQGEDLLALAIWIICQKTAWSLAGFTPSWEQIERCGFSAEVTAVLYRLPALPQRAPMAEIAQRCHWGTLDLGPAVGPWSLGQVLAFCCRQTGNLFADNGPGEIETDELGNEFLFDNPAWLRECAERQRQAQALRTVYDALDRRVRQQPRLLAKIARVLIAAARSFRRHKHEEEEAPRPLVDLIQEVPA